MDLGWEKHIENACSQRVKYTRKYGRPSWTRLQPAIVQMYAEATKRGQYNLTEAEKFWQRLLPTLHERGYDLRPRYQPGWTPSWMGTNIDPTFCEDSIKPMVYNIIDATRKDGTMTAIKRIEDSPDEIRIAEFLSSPEFREDPANHCVPVLDAFPDPDFHETSFLIMPFLRPFDKPEFCYLGEVIEFIEQTLQGIAFMHEKRVAHRDCAALNIMMDSTPLYPRGFHPFRRNYAKDAVVELTPLARIDHPVRYYFVDFGLSSKFEEGASPYVVGGKGRDQDVPELSRVVPYNAYKVDIFILGNLYKKDFLQKYYDLYFLSPLIMVMTHYDPDCRPSAKEALSMFRQIRATLDPASMRWRLRSVNESIPERVIRDTVAVAKEGISNLRRLVGANLGLQEN